MQSKYVLMVWCFLAAACSGKTSAVTSEEKKVENKNLVHLTTAQIQNAGIQTGRAQQGASSTLLKVNGVVDVPPQNMVSISFPLGGFLKSSHLLEGMRVKKGEAIAVMEDQGLIQMQQDYLVAKSRTFFLQKEFERQKLLNTTKATSDKVFEQTESEYQIVRIQANSLAQKLRLIGLNPASITENNIRRSINIYSPINGYVSAVNVNIGKFVNPSDILFELINPNDLHLALKVFEKDLHALRIGQNIKAYMANAPDKAYEAEIILISKNLDENRSALVHCHFTRPAHELLPGMFLSAEIEVVRNDALLVPEEAVVRSGNNQYVFLDRSNNFFEIIPVQVGNTANGKTEVSSGAINLLEQNIIVSNAYAALMKMQNKEE